MRRAVGTFVVAAGLFGVAASAEAGPAGAAGSGRVHFDVYLYATSSISGITWTGTFPTGSTSFVGAVRQTSYADVLSDDATGSIEPFSIEGTSRAGGHRLTGTCSGTGSSSGVSGEPVMDLELELTCTTSVDGGTLHQSAVTVAGVGTGSAAGDHGESWTFDGAYAGRTLS